MRRGELIATLDRVLSHAGLEFTQRLRAIVTRDVIVEDSHRRGRTVLLVEDNPTNQRVAQLFIERAGCDVVLANEGSQALAILRDRPVDLVLMDLQMPVMDGLEAARRIRAGETDGQRLPIVALTASAMKEQVEICKAAGMDDVLAKPIDRAKLEAVLERFAPAVGTRTGRHVVRPAGARGSDTAEVSIARFREVSCGDAELARGLIASFAESAEHSLGDIETGLTRGDFALVRRAAHTLVGASANMGATRLEAVAKTMEESAVQSDGVAIRQLLGAARRRLDAALDALKALEPSR